ncbi:MAG TPA: alpha/beta hydrolase [Mycobacteriales bacterium]|nr:alpha/beta hydrolase [Mycobacteriales bacterium]
MASRAVEESAVVIDGPWTHRHVSANGIRLHVAEAGAGPLILLLHGFPEFWWSWRHQLVALSQAGYRVVAPDLRGYGASDKPPRGYDVPTLAADLAGLVRALGEREAVFVGHDWGGHLAWSVAAIHPAVVRKLAVLSIAHPLRFQQALRQDGAQRRASAYIARFQAPWSPERWLVADDAANVGALLHSWGGPGFPDAETEARCREAMQVLYVPNRALEYYRWSVRSMVRTDGRRYRTLMERPIAAPTLQLHGELDPCILPSTALGSERWVRGPYEWRELRGLGHFPHQEDPELVTAELLRWLAPGSVSVAAHG